jgi:hypothetical protein
LFFSLGTLAAFSGSWRLLPRGALELHLVFKEQFLDKKEAGILVEK